ncbi:hypothetical protein Csa_007637 [Cucumis sativus]|uniref:Uncharacterized protein n=1 Tax=Cucumis sativus TaxID=3659 RepID=A0A0A0LY79_CUCSA|nr:hypothetical protein Csa_007637 [Cucumis sativus]
MECEGEIKYFRSGAGQKRLERRGELDDEKEQKPAAEYWCVVVRWKGKNASKGGSVGEIPRRSLKLPVFKNILPLPLPSFLISFDPHRFIFS